MSNTYVPEPRNSPSVQVLHQQIRGGGIRTCADLTDKILNAILIEPWGFSRSDWNFCLVLNLWNMFITWLGLRGDIKTENRKYLGQCPNKGGGDRNVPILIWKIWKQRGGSLFLKNVPLSAILDLAGSTNHPPPPIHHLHKLNITNVSAATHMILTKL